MAKQTKTTDSAQVQPLATSQMQTATTAEALPKEEVVEEAVSTKQGLPPRLFKAILRLEGCLLAADEQLLLETSDDQTRFVVSSIPNGKVAVKLLTLDAAERKGTFGCWPRPDGSLHLSTFSVSENFRPNPDGPKTNEMLLSGRVSACEADSFIVKVKRNYNRKPSGLRFKKMLIAVSSPPPEAVKPGHWIDLRLQRKGHHWVIPENNVKDIEVTSD